MNITMVVYVYCLAIYISIVLIMDWYY